MRDDEPRARDFSSTDDWPDPEDLSHFESRWRSGDRGSIERSLSETDPPRVPGVLAMLIEAEIRLRREAGEHPTPGEYLARFPEHATSIEVVFRSQGEPWIRDESEGGPGSTELFKGSDGRGPTAIDRDPTEEAGGGPPRGGVDKAGPSKEGCRYRIVSRHDGGGLGEIFIAEDLELNRTVALKEIRERLAADSQARARFLLEAEVIGKLEHPGIVPIYGKGRYRDGRPYYAMRFIKGESLREAITRFHAERDDRPRSEHELMFRGLLGQFVDVCNAIEYAHSRGVVHRDIKPRNVMLGRFGETLVVDWGLAKVLGIDWDVDAMDFPFRPLAADGVDPTRMDKALGTLRYMSPEQAAGQVDRIGPATDIFSLGATLYCLLTGTAPYTASDPEDLQGRAIRCEFPPPRKVHREVPAPLESICLRAMEADPARRYPSARALADDVELWLADEPVSAHEYPVAAKAARWARRHRPQVAAAVALLTTLAIATVSVLEIRAARRRANDNFKIALDAVDQMLGRVSDERLIYIPQMTELRSELADDAVRFLKNLVDQHPNDPQLRWRYSIICSNAAHTHLVSGRLGRFREYCDEMIAIYNSLIADYPAVDGYVNALAYAEIEKAAALQATGQAGPALALFRRALGRAERLAAKGPESPQFRFTVARALTYLSEHLILVGEFEEARDRQQSAITLLESLIPQRTDLFPRRYLFKVVLGRAIVASETNDPGRAREAFDRADGILEALKGQGEKQDDIDNYRSWLLNERGRWLASQPDSAGASERAHDEAYRLIGGLCEKFSDVPEYQVEKATALLHRGLARARLDAEKKGMAEVDLKRSIEVLESLTPKYASYASIRSCLGRAKGALGRYYLDGGEAARARPLLTDAVALQAQCLKENEASPRDGRALDEHQKALERAGSGP